MMKDRNELVYDVRVADRYIREGVITKDDYEQYIKKLPDVSDKGCPLLIDEEAKEEPTAKTQEEDVGEEE
jgi:hypothetical protein